MKILNLFKKKTKATNTSAKKLDKKQLEKVIGGADDAGKDRGITINTTHVEWSK